MKKNLLVVSLSFFLIPYTSVAQDTSQVSIDSINLTGITKSKATAMVFESIIYNGVPVKGILKPNALGSKYHLDIEGNGKSMTGLIYTKEFKRVLDLSFQEKAITGEIKLPVAGSAHKWNVNFLNDQITGAVVYNLAETKATFDLTSKEYKVTGQIKEKVSSVTYNLKINGKSVKGVIKQAPNKQKYSLVLDHLNENELALFFLIESIRMIDEDIEDVEDFQNNSKNNLFD